MRPILQDYHLRLYAITPDGAYRDPAMRLWARGLLQAGVRAIQLREKGRVRRSDLLPWGRFLRAITAEYGALFIVNDDPFLARALRADGCHVGQDDLALDKVRKIMGNNRIVGLSTHDREQVLAAADANVDYIGVGPIFASTSKKAGRTLLGPEFAGWAAANSGLPTVAIGGITLENVAEIAAAGCTNVAVISALARAPQLTEVVRGFLETLDPTDSANLP
jgi:thiamine-phosphate pyrophosphorylase